MNRRIFGIVALVGMLGAAEGFAQRYGGRASAPEGSELDYGGYRYSKMGSFSLSAEWGANFAINSRNAEGERTTSGSPMYVGGTGSYWITDWALLGMHFNYAFNTKRFMAVVGPTFRTDTWPLSFNMGFKAGLSNDDIDRRTRFAISPSFGIDLLIEEHLMIGFSWAWDLQLDERDRRTPARERASQIRMGLNLGWRF
ncbi:MAG: hypothetical protein FWG75_02735 [Cystobacterineae bacterium]|nr:hypothetical protein [Cystobacterineae bacterium]